MAKFAKENDIEIVAVASDHTDRAWTRYFSAEPPYNRAEDRTNRRKDIPDAWIFETAIDLKEKHVELFSLCSDEKLSNAMTSIGIKVFTETQQVLDLIDEMTVPKPAKKTMEISVTVPVLAEVTAASSEGELDAVLAGERERFQKS